MNTHVSVPLPPNQCAAKRKMPAEHTNRDESLFVVPKIASYNNKIYKIIHVAYQKGAYANTKNINSGQL